MHLQFGPVQPVETKLIEPLMNKRQEFSYKYLNGNVEYPVKYSCNVFVV